MHNKHAQIFIEGELKAYQIFTVILIAIAFAIQAWWIVAFMSICHLLNAFYLHKSPYRWVFLHYILPRSTKHTITIFNGRVFRFSYLVTGLLAIVGVFFILIDQATVGWFSIVTIILISDVQA